MHSDVMFRTAAISLTLSLAAGASAWNDDGHRVTGFIARMELEKQRAQGDERAARALSRINSLVLGLKDHQSLDLAATWPDHVRPRYSDLHYINVPVEQYSELSIRWKPISDQMGVVRAIREAQQILKGQRKVFSNEAKPDLKEGATPSEAFALICHFVGDMHMPHHVGDRNDRGGNDSRVDFGDIDRSTGRPLPLENLHSLWDGVVSDCYSLSRDPEKRTRDLETVAIEMMRDYAPKPDAIKEADIEKWAQESYKLAWEVGYQLDLDHGRPGSEQKTNRDGSTRLEKFIAYKAKPNYRANWKRVGLSQVTLAGYRLAEELKRCL